MIVTRTPLRVSLCGGGTDFPRYSQDNPACVLSFAIDKYIYLCIKDRFDDRLRVAYSKTEIVDHPHELEHDIVRAAFQTYGLNKGVELASLADIPAEGCGLGSSSAFAVGLLHAIHHFTAKTHTQAEIAQKACELEIETLGHQIGLQDQWACALGGINLLKFKGMNVYPEPITHRTLYQRMIQRHAMLFYTGTARKAGSILNMQNERTETNVEALNELSKMTRRMVIAIESNNPKTVGNLLAESWELKKTLAPGVTNECIDSWVDIAHKKGAWGTKITGAGGGGFFLVWAPEQAQDGINGALSNAGLTGVPFNIDMTGTTCLLGGL